MDTCDILIVGGGPAGSSCAWKLQQSGLDVLVMDKRNFPRDKTCAGWVTPQVFQALEIDPHQYGQRRVLQPITGFRTGLIRGAHVETQYEKPMSYGIRRCEFDHELLVRSGARCRLGQSVRTMRYSGDRWVVNEEIEARLLVGAGGHACPVARRSGARDDPRASVVTAQEIEFPIGVEQAGLVGADARIPQLYFCDDLRGYGWCFRKGAYLNIGLGRLDSRHLLSHVRGFCDDLRRRGSVSCEIPPGFHGHAYQLYEGVQPRLLDERVMLVGDAAGLAYPQSGEGIRPAVESGLMAARVILEAGGDYGRSSLEPYQRRITERFGRPRAGDLGTWLPGACLQSVAARLLASQWFTRRVVLEKWFLHAHQGAYVA